MKPARGASPIDVDRLDVDSLADSMVHRLLVHSAHDGLGLPIRTPVLVARGARPGPVFGLTAAVHGNELNGIPLIHRLFAKLDPMQLRGTVVGVPVMNVPGYLLHQRVFNDGEDLNRVFPGRPDGNLSQIWAHQFVENILTQFDYLVDLHTASAGRVNSLYVRAHMKHEPTATMARLIRPQIILHNPAPDQTLRGQAMDRGIPAITVEIGNPQRIQRSFVRSSLTGLRNVLAHLKLLPRRAPPTLEQPLICRRSYWIHTDAGGFLEVMPDIASDVRQGELIARVHNSFGDVTREHFAPEDGVCIGKSVNPVAQTGARVLHLGVLGEPEFEPDVEVAPG